MTIKSSKSSNGKSIWFPNHPNHQLCSIYFTTISGIFHYKPSISGIFHYKPEFLGFSTRISTIVSGYPMMESHTNGDSIACPRSEGGRRTEASRD
jgi:hypothetical protein